MFTNTLKPGLLISLKTSIKGGARYARTDIEKGATFAKWETVRVVQDPVDLANAVVARGKARSLITAACVQSSFGLLCPLAKENLLLGAIAQAQEVVNLHNEAATSTRIELYVIAGRVAQDDVEAARAISSEVRDLMEQMEAGIAKADPAAIREAANKARQVGQMLTPAAQAKVQDAVEQARRNARELVRRIEKAGEQAADVVSELNVDKIASARFAFLDLDAPAEFEAVEAAPAPAIDLAPAAETFDVMAAVPSFTQLEI